MRKNLDLMDGDAVAPPPAAATPEPSGAPPADPPQVALSAPPAAAPAEQRFIIHVVAPGETLFGLSRTYFGTGHSYPILPALNRDQLQDPYILRVGTRLRIPVSP